MTSRIVNIDKVEPRAQSHGDSFECQLTPIGSVLESQKLGFNVTTIPPGKRAFPYHAHRANEEMFFILEGEGSLRLPEGTQRIRKGDFISLPPGRDSAHQIINDSKEPLRYLAVSTTEQPEVVEYPDSGKLAVVVGWRGPIRPAPPDAIRHITRMKDGVDYWDGEK